MTTPFGKTFLRACTLIVVASLATFTAPGVAARALDGASDAAPAPGSLLAASDLLMFGSNDLVDVCNTYPVTEDALGGFFETWGAWGETQGEYERVTHDGEEVSPEMLERALLESEGESWTQVFDVAKQCAKAGGWCACASVSIVSGRAVFCAACCPSGTAPFCVCDGIYAYAACGCYQL